MKKTTWLNLQKNSSTIHQKKSNKVVTRQELIKRNTERINSTKNISIIEQIHKLQNFVQLELKENSLRVEKKKRNKTGIITKLNPTILNISRIYSYPLGIIIILFFAAVALPSFLGGCQGEPRDSEAKDGVGTILRSQRDYHYEQLQFSSSLEELGIAFNLDYFTIEIENNSNVAYTFTIANNAEADGVRGYSGAVFFDESRQNYQRIMCQTDNIIDIAPKPIFEDGVLSCPENTVEVKTFIYWYL